MWTGIFGHGGDPRSEEAAGEVGDCLLYALRAEEYAMKALLKSGFLLIMFVGCDSPIRSPDATRQHPQPFEDQDPHAFLTCMPDDVVSTIRGLMEEVV